MLVADSFSDRFDVELELVTVVAVVEATAAEDGADDEELVAAAAVDEDVSFAFFNFLFRGCKSAGVGGGGAVEEFSVVSIFSSCFYKE